MIDLLTFPGWIALWAAIVVVLVAFSAAAVGVITLVDRVARLFWVRVR
jgi:hypothetical protein